MKRSIEKNGRQAAFSVKAIAIGASAGGLKALSQCLSPLPKSFPFPIFVTQHVHAKGPKYLVNLLSGRCNLPVKEAMDKEVIRDGTIYLAPANYHLLIENRTTLALSVNHKVNYARPSIDVLFESAADVFKGALIGIVLTGANQDGAQGLKYIKANGGIAIVQDPTTAEYDAMPKFALAESSIDQVLSLDEIAKFLVSLGASCQVNEKGGVV